MIWSWKIDGNRLTLCDGNKSFVPDARSIYSMLKSTEEVHTFDAISCRNVVLSLPEVRFSRFGSDIQCRFYSSSGKIYCSVFVVRAMKQIPLSFEDGRIIDHCVCNGEWFYVTGDISSFEQYLVSAGITSQGEVSIASYLKALKTDLFSEFSFVINDVDVDDIKYNSSPVDVPKTLNATLYPYQEQGYRWMSYMLEESQGCLLGDEMGLGKTIQVIAVILNQISRGLGPVLVVAPVSLLANWKNECAKFAPSLRTLVHHGPHRTGNYNDFFEYDVIITAYSSISTDFSIINMVNWELVVLDEAQNIKNPDSQRAKFIKKIKRNCNVAITGTPFENHITDIWSLYDFIFPGIFGTVSQFTNKVTDDVIGGKMIEPIITPLMLRRLVKNVAKDLPEKVVISQPLKMSEAEIIEYNKLRQIVSDTLSTEGISIMTIQRLRMFCTHPDVSAGALISDPCATSIKYQRLTEIIEEIIAKSEKVIIFTSYTTMIDIFMNDLVERLKVKTMCIYGETPISERQSIVDQFNEYPRSAVLILNPKAAGVGLNITGANHVIHYNLEWNPALEDQASARSHRRGQKKTVFVYRLFYEQTVEQVINERLCRKRDIADNAIIGTDGAEQDRRDLLAALRMIPEII